MALHIIQYEKKKRDNKMNNRTKQAVILAGGRGERLRPFTDTMPKPMFPIGGVPFITRLVMQVKEFGVSNVLILLGYLAQKVIDELGNGSRLGINIQYDVTPAEFDTAERLRHAQNKLDDQFLLMYCDNYCPVNFEKLGRDFDDNEADIQMSVYSNKDGYTKDNLSISENSQKVELYDKKRQANNLKGVDIGYAIVKKKVVSSMDCGIKSFSSVYPVLADCGKLFATVTDHRYYSIGSYDRLHLTEAFFKPKKAAFIDRDGTLDVRPPKACYVERPEDFQWLPGAREAVKMLNDHGVITILFTNQPGVARGNLTRHTLDLIHKKMEDELEEIGAHMDYLYICTHNWHEGCECRKPKPGLLYAAQRDLSLNIPKECILFGDDERDLLTAGNADCRSCLITEEHSLLDAVSDYCRELGEDR